MPCMIGVSQPKSSPVKWPFSGVKSNDFILVRYMVQIWSYEEKVMNLGPPSYVKPLYIAVLKWQYPRARLAKGVTTHNLSIIWLQRKFRKWFTSEMSSPERRAFSQLKPLAGLFSLRCCWALASSAFDFGRDAWLLEHYNRLLWATGYFLKLSSNCLLTLI